MHLPKFEYFRPSTVGEATRFLKEHGPQARVVAGGTDLFPRMKYGLDHPEVVVSLKGIPIKPPTESRDGTLHLDALMVLSEVIRSPVILDKAPLLAKAAGRVASGEIRNMGTLGGNICQESRCLYYNQSHSFQFVEPCFKRGGKLCYFVPKGKKCLAVYMADTAPALMCLDAEVKIIGPEGERQMPVGELYSGDAKHPLNIGPNEILAKVIIPPQPATSGWAYKKFSLRGGLEFAAVGVASILQMDEGGKICRQARIAVGAIASSPFRAPKAETHLVGKEASDSLFEEAAEFAADEIKIIPHHGFSAPYLREVLKVQTKRALKGAYERARR
ncbi:MAG: FAD binding domain-containing protein [Deltaproteobacteria bacterium]|nr:FAD binding domain-containing protein [Deltaproteobacteria bacterium]